MGMTYDQYWYGDPLMVRAIYKAYQQKQEAKINLINYEAWLHGLYNFNALGIALGNVLRKDGTPPENYPSKPLDMSGKEEKLDEDVELALAESYMKQMVRMGKNWGKDRKAVG